MDWDETVTTVIIGICVVAVIGIIFGSVLYGTIDSRAHTTERLKMLDGMNRCIYICATETYGESGEKGCLEKCEDNYVRATDYE